MKTKFFLSALFALTAGAFSSCSQTPAKEAVLWLGWDSDVIKGPVLQAEYVMEDEDGGTVAHEICYFDADGHIVRQEGKHQYATPLLERVYDGDFCCKETTTDRDGKVEVILFEKQGNKVVSQENGKTVERVHGEGTMEVYKNGILFSRTHLNEMGQDVSIDYFDMDGEALFTKTYEYDESFNLVSMDGGDLLYTYEQEDSHGNWTLCRIHDTRLGSDFVIRRTLTYPE